MDLERLLREEIAGIKKGNVSKRCASYRNFGEGLKFEDNVTVKVTLKGGITAEIDITDLLKGI